MLLLVLAGNLLFTFVGWEGVGACSYWLVAFWFERDTAASAGKKAFIYNRIGDVGFLLAMFLIFSKTGSLQYTVIFSHLGSFGPGARTAACLLLFLAAAGKSAQIPLFPWLADAMEGPTPVSALIHAATMVTSGVYLLCRMNPLLALSHDSQIVIATIGVATALVAATIACAQNDIKKVLAYSTISQLGYMFLAVGSGAYVAAIFLMVAHAFFKGQLFLGAGSVIHGMDDEQDLKKMGGLRSYMPITAATFVFGWLAIAGVFPLVGILGQRRRPFERLRTLPRAVGHRSGHCASDRVLHDAALRARLHRGLPLATGFRISATEPRPRQSARRNPLAATRVAVGHDGSARHPCRALAARRAVGPAVVALGDICSALVARSRAGRPPAPSVRIGGHPGDPFVRRRHHRASAVSRSPGGCGAPRPSSLRSSPRFCGAPGTSTMSTTS